MSDVDYRDLCLSEKEEVCHVCGDRDDLRVHHIDGDRSNNTIDNLIPLCRTCHAKVHTKTSQTPEIDELTSKLKSESFLDTPSNKDTTSVLVKSHVRDKLRGEKVGNETYSDVIERLIEDDE